MSSPLEIALRLQTVKVFDYCTELETEVGGILFGILFAVARYTPFVDVPVDLIYSLGPTSSQVCLSLYQVGSWFNIIGTVAAESLLLVRTYTLWGRNRVLLVSLLLLALGCIAGSAVVGAKALSWFQYQDPPLGTSGCYQSQRIAIYAVDYALLVLFETGHVLFSCGVTKADLTHSHTMSQCVPSVVSPRTTEEPSHCASVLGWYSLCVVYTSNVNSQHHSHRFPSVRIRRFSEHTPDGVSQRFILPPSFQLTSHHETTT
ncbi:uncharacterized protein F5147DRAFT_686937 [Suillus discolor]|uniref:Uncharacterized protein n=1 Tax=Suillus discolor TaxID=1912936 RepID=A0A9P7JVU7_9AGAM|nr:uncharacterized protein F5147DRAFT_686937 [Suillus discolor]KAG2111253.1 hypothetical protein F5147DRAFT_686937 [Suillus discolor]